MTGDDWQSDTGIQAIMTRRGWSLDDLDRELNSGRLGARSRPKAMFVAEYIEHQRRLSRSQTENDAYDLNLRMVKANEASADASKTSARSAVLATIISLFALFVAVAAYLHEASKP